MSRPWYPCIPAGAWRPAFAFLIAWSTAGTSHAGPTTYQGEARAVDYSHPQATSGATTFIAAGYFATLSGNTATSLTSGATGGSAEVMATSAFGGSAGANAHISYRVDLVGPSGVYVPIHIVAAGYAEAVALGPGGGSRSDATFLANFNMATESQIFGNAVTDSLGGRVSFLVDRVVRVYGGSYFDIDLDVSAGAGGPGQDPAFAHSFIDPIFTIDPEFAALYHLEGIPTGDVDLPPDLPPIGTVPEPAPVLLICGAFVAMALRGRRGSVAEPDFDQAFGSVTPC